MTELNNQTSLDKWREAKEEADKSYAVGSGLKGALGCVGEPLYDVLREHLLELPTFDADDLYVKLVKAAESCREGIAGIVQEEAQNHVDWAMEELRCGLYADDGDIDTSVSIAEVYTQGYEACESEVQDFYYSVPDIDGRAL